MNPKIVTVPERVLSWAASEVGVSEATGKNDGTPQQRYMNGEKIPGGKGEGYEWCAAFVSRGFQLAGHPLPGNQRKNWEVAELWRQLERAGATKIPLIETAPGDLAVFPRGKKLYGHVELVERVTVSDGGLRVTLHTIGGNVGNAVRRVEHRFDFYPGTLGRVGSFAPEVNIARWPLALSWV